MHRSLDRRRAAAFALLVACSSPAPSREPAPVKTAPVTPAAAPAPADAGPSMTREEVMEKMQGFADRMCACHDPTCGQQIADEMNAWSRAMSDRPDPPNMTEQDTQHARELGERMGRCMQQAMSGSAAK
jgi:hypothetical protein